MMLDSGCWMLDAACLPQAGMLDELIIDNG
jgi:hypothetical protein